MSIIQSYLAECARMVRDGYFYDNSGSRCNPNPYKGRDCSTFVAFALIAAGVPGVNPCNNSFGFAAECFNTPRPDWFTARFGPGQGTFINHDQALNVVCWGFRGSNFGRAPDSSGDGHIETSLGNGGASVGAHSHATGIGYSQFDAHQLSSYAVPPAFLAEMAPQIPKVAPMYDPNLKLAARLWHPLGRGIWEAYDNGVVDFVYNRPRGRVFSGGMVRPDSPTDPTAGADRAAWGDRHVSHLEIRRYRKGIGFVWGYTIVATTGERYVPGNQR